MQCAYLFKMLQNGNVRSSLTSELIDIFKTTRYYPHNESVKLEEYFTLNFYKKSDGWRNVFQFKTRASDSQTHLHGTISQEKMFLPDFYFGDEQKRFDDILLKYYREFILSELL